MSWELASSDRALVLFLALFPEASSANFAITLQKKSANVRKSNQINLFELAYISSMPFDALWNQCF
ncbi:MAG: hypothetical protein DCF15_00680 [Phormidesmis priestleyi]|uniref:Uncharacterized protein n=1 Tax=Phormidesmis priestleyi TaxID=268141 RepID=A0A2W4XZN5_9CYAN|nr:MAG: hypothetical protein DCF15_00680 [Phormidesmis priestleyi]